MRHPATAFTLIELLVVITIIVVLLALLVPAMDQAIYQAELASCGTKLKAISTAMSTYAVGGQRWYPYNSAYEKKIGWHGPLLSNKGQRAAIAGQGAGTATPLDMRLLYQQYFALNKTLIDPMIRPIDIEGSTGNLVYGSYSLWNTWAWTAAASLSTKRQAKIGDRFTYQALDGVGPEYRWDILAGDFMRAIAPTTTPGTYWTCHPAKKDTSRLILQNGPVPTYGTVSLYSFWVSNITPGRDPVDYNVVRQDGAVQILDNVAYNDERLIDVPEFYTGPGANDAWHQLPIR